MFIQVSWFRLSYEGALWIFRAQATTKPNESVYSKWFELFASGNWLESERPGLQVTISSKGFLMQLNGFFLNSGVHGMLEGKACHPVDTVFPIIGGYIDRETGVKGDANLTGVPRMSSDTMFKVVSQNYGRELFVAELQNFCAETVVHLNIWL